MGPRAAAASALTRWRSAPVDAVAAATTRPSTRDRTVLCPGPLVEGLVVAAATASTGADRHRVSADATAALGPKRSHLGLSWESS